MLYLVHFEEVLKDVADFSFAFHFEDDFFDFFGGLAHGEHHHHPYFVHLSYIY